MRTIKKKIYSGDVYKLSAAICRSNVFEILTPIWTRVNKSERKKIVEILILKMSLATVYVHGKRAFNHINSTSKHVFVMGWPSEIRVFPGAL